MKPFTAILSKFNPNESKVNARVRLPLCNARETAKGSLEPSK
jgi:hypothetical protein